MTPSVEISIPSAQTSDNGYTVYNINIRLPLRSFTLPKRFSDFVTFHSNLTSQAGTDPPAPLPPKSWFSRTVSNPELTEQRRQTLQTYLQTINSSPHAQWRDTSAWRSFLTLPASSTSSSAKSSVASDLHGALLSSAPMTDPVMWLDGHREAKTQLHEARLQITKRDQASTAQAQHEASAQAKKHLVKAGGMISSLEQGLKKQDDWRSEKLGEGEVRRRRDLVASAKKDKDTLEGLLSAMAAKSRVDATVKDREALIGPGGGGGGATGGRGGGPRTGGRVLGKETSKTRELDNAGVLGLQKQLMEEQDEDVTVLAQAVRRQKELGIAIQEELEVQTGILGLLDEDVDRVGGKIEVAKKRVNKIS